jgi:hypothetical protein
MQKKGGLDDHLPDDFNGRGKKGGALLITRITRHRSAGVSSDHSKFERLASRWTETSPV